MANLVLNSYQEIVTLDDVPQDSKWEVLHALLEYLKLEIVREATPDYTLYELRSKS